MNTLFASTFGHHPNTNCGKGFESLVKGSQDYRTTAMVKLYTHPWHTMDNATFEREGECWRQFGAGANLVPDIGANLVPAPIGARHWRQFGAGANLVPGADAKLVPAPIWCRVPSQR